MKLLIASIILFAWPFCANALADECKSDMCVLEEVDFSPDAEFPYRSRVIFKLGANGKPVPEKLPVMALYRPAFVQRFVSISVKSDEDYHLDPDEIAEINTCVAERRRCLVSPKKGAFKAGDWMELDFYWDDLTEVGLGRGRLISFQEGVESRVVMKEFQGNYSVQGARVKSVGESIVVESKGEGYLLFSETSDWKTFAKRWAGVSDPEAVKAIAREIFPEGVSQDEAVRIAREWIATNIEYENRPQTAQEMQQPTSVSGVVSSRKGECKSMTMLLQSLLASVGVQSRAVFTRFYDKESMRKFDPEIPEPSYFNHVILYVPALDRYYDATLGGHQLDEEITEHLYFGLHTGTGELVCFGARYCNGVAQYRIPQ